MTDGRHQGEPHLIYGELVDRSHLEHPLATSLFDYVDRYGGRDAAIDAAYKVDEGVEVVAITVTTSTPQHPAYPILPVEPLAVFFYPEHPPIVVPLRPGFPSSPHSYGLPVEIKTSAEMSLCIDDRPWDDARGDYSGPEIIYRIHRWLDRTATGDINDALQAPDLAFLPSPVTVMISDEVRGQLTQSGSPPYFISLRATDKEKKFFEALPPEKIAESPGDGKEWVTYVGIGLEAEVENAGVMWRAPTLLGHLRQSISGADFDLITDILDRISEMIEKAGNDLHLLYNSQLLIEVSLANVTAERMESFFLLTNRTIGDVGVGLGLLYPPNIDINSGFTTRLPAGEIDQAKLDRINLFQANHVRSFDAAAATFLSGRDCNCRDPLALKGLVLGVGSIGSQVITNLIREGAFTELVLVDDDHLAPHNLVRHALRSSEVGRSKSLSFAEQLVAIRPDLNCSPVHGKFGQSTEHEEIVKHFPEAELVLDMTASVGASRKLSDHEDRSRAISAFFNPMGNAVVVVAEDEAKDHDLGALEAIYYGMIIRDERLHDHLQVPNIALIGGGQCRATTNRISSSDAAVLSGLAAKHIGSIVARKEATILINHLDENGSVTSIQKSLTGPQIIAFDAGWTARVSSDVIGELSERRSVASPNETGGVLLGIVDHARKRIEVVAGLPATPDSIGTPSSFERGVRDLREMIDQARHKTMDQIVYIGEWHTHPDGASVDPSPVDNDQLKGLRSAMRGQQRPIVMLIVGAVDANLILGGGNI
ncbi:MAG: ThiF family adenylyltransferase [Thalassovita sp.]